MNYATVCSGIEAPTVAWRDLGWRPQFFAEIARFPRAVLAHHYPSIPNLGDITQYHAWPTFALDVLTAGTPCQPFSIAGLRKGMDDPRGHLTLTFLALAARYRPRWLVWENVPGVLSDDRGAFSHFLAALGELRYGFAWRVLDAQYFGIPQRRRRVFLIGHSGNWQCAAAALFNRESLRGHLAPRGAARPRHTGTAALHPHPSGQLQPVALPALANTLTARMTKGVNTTMDEGQTMVPMAFDYKRNAEESDALDLSPTLRAQNNHTAHANGGGAIAVAIPFDVTQLTTATNRSSATPGAPCHALAASAKPPAIAGAAVRRLTPLECERLQGFPDHYTRIPLRLFRERRITPRRSADRWEQHELRWVLMAEDGPRYKALGNSMAVPVVRWIGERIALVDALAKNTYAD